jgi:hypothetical protein
MSQAQAMNLKLRTWREMKYEREDENQDWKEGREVDEEKNQWSKTLWISLSIS